MTINQIKILAQKSFTKNELDYKRVKIFVSNMKRKDLRRYVREVKFIDSKNKIRVLVPNLKTFKKSEILMFLKKYKGKKIMYEENPALLVGLQLIDNDLVYDFNLKNTLEEIMQSYD